MQLKNIKWAKTQRMDTKQKQYCFLLNVWKMIKTKDRKCPDKKIAYACIVIRSQTSISTSDILDFNKLQWNII
jgi:hypothetical protein